MLRWSKLNESSSDAKIQQLLHHLHSNMDGPTLAQLYHLTKKVGKKVVLTSVHTAVSTITGVSTKQPKEWIRINEPWSPVKAPPKGTLFFRLRSRSQYRSTYSTAYWWVIDEIIGAGAKISVEDDD